MDSKKFVIVVDAQVDFMKPEGNLPVPGADQIIEPINEFLKELGSETVGVLYTFDTHSEETYPGSPEAEMFPGHCFKGSPGWELAVTQDVEPYIYTLEKNVFNMWEEPNLVVKSEQGFKADREFFFDLLKSVGVTEIVVLGVAADFCVKWAADGLLDRDFGVTIPEGLTKGIERQIKQVNQDDWKNAVSLV